MEKSEEIVLSHLVLPIIKDLVIPKIKSIIKKFSIKSIDENSISTNFQEYLSQRYEKFLIIDTLAFPNKQTLFKELYEPLTLISKEDYSKPIEIKINSYPEKFLPKYVRVIIEDTAGMGKSTLTKKLFLSIIEQNCGIPVLIELRQINKNNDFLKEIQNQLSGIGTPIPLEIILKLINEGEFIFFFDGFDEISKSDREFVIKDLHRFIEKANNSYLLIASRPDDSLVSFGDFQKFNIKPLVENEAFSLIRRYDSYSYKPIAKELIEQLQYKKDVSLREFLSNPFLVSLLYKSFEYKKDIPLKKCQFYRQVYDALFESHDLSKEGYLKREKYCNLHLDDFERVLRYVGFLTAIENKIEYDKNKFLNIVDKAKTFTPDLVFKSSDFLNDLLETVPLFRKDGNYIKWAHKSLQDYFSAKFIWIDARNNQESILKKIYEDDDNKRFYNILDLFNELDPKTFEVTILLWLLEDFQKYCKSSYNKLPGISAHLIKQRIENNYHKECIIVVTKKEDFNSIRLGKEKTHQYYRDKINKLNFDDHTITCNYFMKSNIATLTFISDKSNLDTILELASSRFPELAAYKVHKIDLDKLILLKEDSFYKVNDDVNNIVNDIKIFELVSDLTISGFTLNYDNCLKKLKQIKKIYSTKRDNDLINW